jgi:hypothetical protein
MGQMRIQLNVGSFQRDKKSCCLKILTSSVPSRLSNRTVSAPVCLVHDIDHERLRFLTDQPRKSRTGNLAVGRPDYHVYIVLGLRVRSNPGSDPRAWCCGSIAALGFLILKSFCL